MVQASFKHFVGMSQSQSLKQKMNSIKVRTFLKPQFRLNSAKNWAKGYQVKHSLIFIQVTQGTRHYYGFKFRPTK